MYQKSIAVYGFDDHGFFAGAGVAYLDELASTPEEPAYIMPSNSTMVVPSGEAGEYRIWRWDGKRWGAKPDYSHAEVWRVTDGLPGSPPPVGEPLSADLTIQRPPEPATKQVRRWIETSGVWEVVTDHRGETWYSKETGVPVLVETIDLPYGLTEFPRPETPSPYHLWKGGKWVLTAAGKVDMARAKRAALLDEIAAKRYAVETGGLILPIGMCIGTDRQDQAIITGAISAIQLGQSIFDWKGADGTWITLTDKQIMQIGATVAAHVQACFSAERRHCELVAELKDNKLDEYDINAGWPSNIIGG